MNISASIGTAASSRAASVRISTFSDAFAHDVVELVLAIQQQEYGVPVTLEEQPDLNDIPGVYQRDRGNFWIALEGEAVIGTLGLLDVGADTGVIKKMYVRDGRRGKGLGKKLLETLIQWAEEKGLCHLYLGTYGSLEKGQLFYKKNGFLRVSEIPSRVEEKLVAADTERFYRKI